MSRTVTAIFSSRSEAESARLRLGSAVKVQSAQVLARETAAALDSLAVDERDAQSCREALLAGDHVLVATIARGEDGTLILDALTGAGDVEKEGSGPRLSYDIGAPAAEGWASRIAKQEPPQTSGAQNKAAVSGTVTSSPQAKASSSRHLAASPEARVERTAPAPDPVPAPAPHKEAPEIRIGQPRAAQSAAGPTATSTIERDAFESRAPARRLSQEEVEAGGLLKNRVIEVVEMREEPVISKEVVIREEVIIRKTVNERVETVDDTVRRTEVEIEELP